MTPVPTPAPATPIPPPHCRPLRNGNPAGNPNLAPRCGAKNRVGCPCRAPAMPNGRCRLHGGNSTGPRAPEGLARMTAAHTRHGGQSAPKRAQQLYVRTLTRRTRLSAAARRLLAYLPREMAARLADGPPELWAPIHPSNLPYVTNSAATPGHGRPARLPPDAGRPRDAARSLPRALAAERQAARAEAASLAPWRQAIAFARAAKRATLAAKRTVRAAKRTARAAKRAAGEARRAALAAKRTTRQAGRAARGPAAPEARPPTPDLPGSACSLLERELAARKAGLRARLGEPDQPAPAEAPNPDSTFSRIDPVNPETAATPTPKANSAFSRINPMNPEKAVAAAPAPNPDSTFSRIDPVNPETAATPTPKANSAFSRINLMNPEKAVAAAPAPNSDSTFSRIDPVNPDTTARAQKPNSAFSRIDPVNPDTTVPSQPTRLTPTKAEALRATTLANTWDPTLRATLEKRCGPAPPPPGWFAPQAWPPPPGTGMASTGGDEKSSNHRHAT